MSHPPRHVSWVLATLTRRTSSRRQKQRPSPRLRQSGWQRRQRRPRRQPGRRRVGHGGRFVYPVADAGSSCRLKCRSATSGPPSASPPSRSRGPTPVAVVRRGSAFSRGRPPRGGRGSATPRRACDSRRCEMSAQYAETYRGRSTLPLEAHGTMLVRGISPGPLLPRRGPARGRDRFGSNPGQKAPSSIGVQGYRSGPSFAYLGASTHGGSGQNATPLTLRVASLGRRTSSSSGALRGVQIAQTGR